MQRGTVGSRLGSVEVGQGELVDRCGSSQVVSEASGGRPTVIKAVPTPGWQTSSVTKPATCSPVVMMWETVARVSFELANNTRRTV